MGKDSLDIYRAAVQGALAGHGLRERLPLTYELSERQYADDWGEVHWQQFVKAHAEIGALIEIETHRAAEFTPP